MFLSKIYNFSHVINQNIARGKIIAPKLIEYPLKQFHTSYQLKAEENEAEASGEKEEIRDPAKDRTKVIPVETSIRYIQSQAYADTYGTEPVWKLYRRNHRGPIAPLKTRKTCIRKGKISTGNPCPICRDEYLVLKPENTELLEQFISPFNGKTLSYSVTGICQKKHRDLLVSIEIAKDRGLIKFDLPFREYDYSLYKKIKQ